MITDVVHVSVGLSLDGGGATLLGRLIATSAAEYCREHGLRFRILHLDCSEGILPGVKIRHFNRNQRIFVAQVLRCQLTNRQSVLLFDHPGTARIQALLPFFLRRPYLLFLLGIDVWLPLKATRRRALENAQIRLSISDYTRIRAREFNPWLPPMEVVHLALEDRCPQGERDKQLLQRVGEDFLLIVGRMAQSERYKGHDELLQIMPDLAAIFPNIRLVIVGKGNDMSRLQVEVKRRGLQNHVLFTGFVSEATLAELYKRCRAFVMPSYNEGFGLVYLEAMKASKPCVALRDTAAAEIVLHQQTGLLIDRSDLRRQLYSALVNLMTDDALVIKLGQAGYERWRNHFSYANFHTQFSAQLQQLIEKAK